MWGRLSRGGPRPPPPPRTVCQDSRRRTGYRTEVGLPFCNGLWVRSRTLSSWETLDPTPTPPVLWPFSEGCLEPSPTPSQTPSVRTETEEVTGTVAPVSGREDSGSR